MAGERASDASSDSSNTYWDLATCAAAVAAYATENPSEMAMYNQIAVTPVPFEVQEATGRQWVEASLRDAWRCYENSRAIDGTHVPVCVSRRSHDDYLNRKGWPSQNVLAVVDFDMRFTFIGVGMAGAVHDMAVLREGWGHELSRTHHQVGFFNQNLVHNCHHRNEIG